ncbi:uncharacterized protein [Nicotiana sylvestris]|uniref:uncharacterized protein n=1 Tax=Nicotiana sylvestris TaxID=4096 RepID=UPI00388C4ABD
MQAEDRVIPKVHTLSGFDNSSVVTKGEVILTTFTEGVIKDTKFQVVDMEMAYNVILGRPWIHEMDVIPSTLHQVIKFPSPWRICQIRGDQHISRAINSVANTSMRIEEPEENENIKITVEQLDPVVLFAQWPDKKVYVGANLDQRMEVRKKQDHFEWNEECQQALRNLKTYLSNPPLLAKPKAGEKLLTYLAVSEVAVSAVLVREEQAREARMQQYLEKVRELIKQFQNWKVRQIPRDENLEADALANLASVADVANDANASVIHLFHSVLDPDVSEVNFNNLTWDWRNEIVAFLYYGTVHDDKKKAYALRRKTARYCLKQGNLYRKMLGGPLARCLGPSQTEYVMREIHEGHRGNHAGGRSLVRTLIRAGYYWPKMEEETESFIAKCDKCQRYGAQITEFLQSWQLKRITSTPYHPVGNGQAESTNKVIINNLKKRLEESKGNWPEVLPGVLWAYRTMAKTSTGETPFLLVYGTEALIPVEIGEPSTRFTQATQESNDEEMRVNLDLLEARREAALIRMAAQNKRRKIKSNMGRTYKVRDVAGKGAYELETMDGKVLPSHCNAVHLKRYYF